VPRLVNSLEPEPSGSYQLYVIEQMISILDWSYGVHLQTQQDTMDLFTRFQLFSYGILATSG